MLTDAYMITISKPEEDLTLKRIEELKHAGADGSLVNVPSDQDFSFDERPKMFEIRFAGMLLDQVGVFEYERLGVGKTSGDFAFDIGGTKVFLEAVSIDQSKAVSNAVTFPATGRIGRALVLRTDAADQRESPQGEVIKIQEKIGEKVLRKGKPTKFLPIGQDTHLIVCDVRGYGGAQVPDLKHLAQMIYGFRHLQENGLDAYVLSYENQFVTGLFDSLNMREPAVQLRNRIHAIGISLESSYHRNELAESIMWFPNPFISDAAERVKSLSFGIVYNEDLLHKARGFVYR